MKKQKPRYPDYLCIGAYKAGTTWLFSNLHDHPAICRVAVKEIQYFNSRGRSFWSIKNQVVWCNIFKFQFIQKMLRNSPAQSLWLARYLFLRRTDSWYASLFCRCGHKLAGDVTPAYSILDAADVAHIATLMPAVKIILLLRDPVARAWSHLRMEFERGARPFRDMTYASIADVPFDLLKKHLDSKASRLRGDYQRTLDIWGTQFPSDQMFIGFSEEINADPARFLDRVATFLGLDPKDAAGWPRATQRFNALPDTRMPPEVARYLAREYLPGLRQLETNPRLTDRAYVTAWRRNAEQLLAS